VIAISEAVDKCIMILDFESLTNSLIQDFLKRDRYYLYRTRQWVNRLFGQVEDFPLVFLPSSEPSLSWEAV